MKVHIISQTHKTNKHYKKKICFCLVSHVAQSLQKACVYHHVILVTNYTATAQQLQQPSKESCHDDSNDLAQNPL